MRFPYPTDPEDIAPLGRVRARCSCTWEADPFDHPRHLPYISDLDEACEQHGRDAQPELWSRLAEIDVNIERAVAASAVNYLAEHDDDCPNCGRAKAGAECAACGTQVTG